MSETANPATIDIAALKAQRIALDLAIAEAALAQRVGAIETVRSLVAGHDLIPADVWPSMTPKPRPKRVRKTNGNGASAPKFRDPETGATYAGRGARPAWLKAKIAAGHSQEEFRVQLA